MQLVTTCFDESDAVGQKKPQLVGLFCGTNYIVTFKSDLYKSLFN